MHATLNELLENLKSGMLWVSRDGVVRHVNAEATMRTGLVAGRRLYDPDLLRAVSSVVEARSARVVTASGVPLQPGGVIPELRCRVIPGLSADDAFVLIGKDESTDNAAGFDNLMRVIEHDLRAPLSALTRELAGARSEGALQKFLPALDDALSLLDKLVDLASVWGSSALLASDRIELWPLLQQVWDESQALAQSRSIKVQFHARTPTESLAALYGSEPWLRRVFAECLASALRTARPGATLNIEHMQMGPRALIVFRDCGVFAAQQANAIDMQNKTPARSLPRLTAHDQIGLKLCQHIVSLHGGQLREEHEDGQCSFMIDLPTGAPHRAEHAPADTAQAQQYAKDLAALMGRRRAGQSTSNDPQEAA
jgi:signal transduction histidine kinase